MYFPSPFLFGYKGIAADIRSRPTPYHHITRSGGMLNHQTGSRATRSVVLTVRELPTPTPDGLLVSNLSDWFMPSPEMGEWIYATFITEGASLENLDHAHLQNGRIGLLWTNVDNSKKGRTVIGTAELGKPQGAMGKWNRSRAELQVFEWFGQVPDFIITIHAGWWVQAGDAERCVLIEHELYHCAQDRDTYGAPKFNQSTGRPSFVIRGHDVEEFVGVVRRYGADASGVRQLVDAANDRPEIAAANIAHACGNCA